METKTIEGFPYWEFEDRDAALRVGPVVFLQSTFPDWAPCVLQAWPGFSFPRVALLFHARSCVYGLYFVVSFPMFLRIDEEENGAWSPTACLHDALACGMAARRDSAEDFCRLNARRSHGGHDFHSRVLLCVSMTLCDFMTGDDSPRHMAACFRCRFRRRRGGEW